MADPTETMAASPSVAPGTDAPRAKKRRRRIIFSVAIVVVLAAGIIVGKLGGGGGSPASAPLPPTPHFSLARLGGGAPVTFPDAAMAHHPVVLVFFASWCGPCQKELPALAHYVHEVQASRSPVRFIGIDGNDQNSSGLAFARKSGVTFPAAADHEESVAYQLGLGGLPDTVFISARHKIVHIVQGAVSVSALRHWIHVLSTTA